MKKMRLVSRGFRECFNIRSLIQEGLIVYSTLHRDWAWAKRLLACTHAERPGRGSKSSIQSNPCLHKRKRCSLLMTAACRSRGKPV
jgi:hypothetical protein